MYVNVSEYMYVYHVYACACGRQKVPDLLKLELGSCELPDMRAGNNLGPLQEQQVLSF